VICDCRDRPYDYRSVGLSRSAREGLCLGAAAAFSLGVGRGREGGGAPRRSRALALTALEAEKTRFVCLDLAMEFGGGFSVLRPKASDFLDGVGRGSGALPAAEDDSGLPEGGLTDKAQGARWADPVARGEGGKRILVLGWARDLDLPKRRGRRWKSATSSRKRQSRSFIP
jgi:hypothetical protein